MSKVAAAEERASVIDVDRSRYDFIKSEEGSERLAAGLTPDIVREISARKEEPEIGRAHV